MGLGSRFFFGDDGKGSKNNSSIVGYLLGLCRDKSPKK